jgi:hypothetical protein
MAGLSSNLKSPCAFSGIFLGLDFPVEDHVHESLYFTRLAAVFDYEPARDVDELAAHALQFFTRYLADQNRLHLFPAY